MGQGSSNGVEVKLCLVRADYAVDHNSGTGAVFFRFGTSYYGYVLNNFDMLFGNTRLKLLI